MVRDPSETPTPQAFGCSAAVYRDDADDADLVREGVTERRIVVTQDRGCSCGGRCGGYVRGDRPDNQLADVLDRFAPPLAPLTRCTACNGEVDAVAPEEVADRHERDDHRRLSPRPMTG